MNSTSSWVTPLVTFGGVLLTLLVTVWIDHRKGQRDTRFQWTTHLLTLYREFLAACNELRKAPIWPSDPSETPVDVDRLVTRIRDVSSEALFLAHRDVAQRMSTTAHAAEEMAAAIRRVRENSKPGHRGAVDERQRPVYDMAFQAFTGCVDDFIAAGRADLDLRSPFEPVGR